MGEQQNIKQQVLQLLETLPDDCTFEDVQYHLYVLDKVAKSEARASAEGTISHEEAKRRFAKWLAP